MLNSELSHALQNRTLALFIGADLPRAITGLPSRADLARDLARRKDLDQALSLAEVAQRVSQAGNRWEFTNFIRSALDTSGQLPPPFHRRIVALVLAYGLETVITVAYDNLLELAFQQAGAGFNRLVRGSDAGFITPGRPTLVKLYGDVGQPDTLVVTDRDHGDLVRDRDKEALLDEVRRAFRSNTVLFVGYNLSDPDFRFIFDQIAQSRLARLAYAVWPGLPEADARMWRDRGIVILDDDPFDLPGAEPVAYQADTPRSPEIGFKGLDRARLQALRGRQDALIQDYKAANAQLDYTLSEVDRARLRRQIDFLEQEIRAVQEALANPGAAASAWDPEGDGVQQLRLDAAVPDQVYLNQAFDLAVAVRRPGSAVLKENDLERVASGAMQVTWPEDSACTRLRIQVSAPGCQVLDGDSCAFTLYHGYDSPVFFFKLVPRQIGLQSIVVKVCQQDDWLGSARVNTIVRTDVVGAVVLKVVSQALKLLAPGRGDPDSRFQQIV